MHMPTKKYLIEKANKLCLMGQIVDRKSQLSGILTEPLNPRVLLPKLPLFKLKKDIYFVLSIFISAPAAIYTN